MKLKVLYVSLAALSLMACSEKTSLEYMESAKTLIQSNNNSEAVIELKKAIKQDAKFADARFLLGKVYFNTHNYESAEKELEKALDNGYSEDEVYPLLLKAQINARDYYALIDLKIDESKLSNKSLVDELNFYKLNAYVNLNQQKEFEELYRSISTERDNAYVKLSHILNELKNAGQIGKEPASEKLAAWNGQLNDILSTDPKNQFALKYQAVVSIMEKDFDKTVSIYDTYLAEYPADIEAKFKYIDLMINLERAKEVEPIIDDLLRVNEKHPALNRFKGIARYAEKDYEGALKFAEKGLMTDTTDVSLRLLAGQSSFTMEKFEEAARHIMLISNKLDPRHNALRILALSLLNSNDPIEASNVLMSMEGLTERDSLLFSNTSIALIESGERVRAEKLMNRSEGLGISSESLASRGIVEISLNSMNGIGNLKKAIEKQPEDNRAKIALASAYLQTNELKELSIYLEDWLSKDSDNLQALYFKAQLQLRSSDEGGAKVTFNRIVELDDSNIDARMSLVSIARKNGDTAEANRLVKEVLEKDPNYAPAIAQMYVSKKESGDAGKVLADLKAKVNENPDDIDLALLLSGMLISENKLSEALEQLNKFQTQESMPSRYWVMLAEIYAKKQDLVSLEATNAKWLAQYPGNKEAIISSLMALSTQNKFKEALEISQSYLSRQGKNDYIQLLNSHFLVMTGDFNGAKASMRKLPQELSQIPFAKGILGRIQVADKNFEAGLANLKAAYETEKNHENVKLIYRLSEFMGKKEDGYEFLKAHVKSFPNDLLSLMMLADVQLSLDQDAAISNYEKLVSINSKNIVALNNLANLYLMKDELVKAEKLAKDAVAIRNDVPSIIDTLASVYTAQKNHDAALVEFRKAAEMKNVSNGIYLNYIEALVVTNNRSEAEREIYKYKAKFKQPHMLKALEERQQKLGL